MGELKYIDGVQHVNDGGKWRPATPADVMQSQVINAGKGLFNLIKGGDGSAEAAPAPKPEPSDSINKRIGSPF